MAELVAQGKDGVLRWRHELPAQPITLGRTADSIWQASWDKKISRVHATLHWQDGQLAVRRLPISLNPIFYQGVPRDEFLVPPGGRFIIGDTSFVVIGETPTAPSVDLPAPNAEMTCGPEELHQFRFVDANERIEVLAALPAVIRFSPSEAELETQVAGVLLRGIPRAAEAAIVCLRGLGGPGLSPGGSGDPAIEVRLVKNRQGLPNNFRPSRRLVLEAILRRKQSVMHIWRSGEVNAEYTVQAGHDWAICTPLLGDQTGSWGLYVTGSLSGTLHGGPLRDDLLKSDLKFTELVADIFSSLQQVGRLQSRLGRLKTFLPRPVLGVLAGMAERDVEAFLKPRPATVTVLFCDIRGSCAIAERGQNDLMHLWDDVSGALGVMSSSILEQEGVIGDFQGDAVMAFWGWPLDAENQRERAFRAALTICNRLARVPREGEAPAEPHPAAKAGSAGASPSRGSETGGTHFSCGIGIAHGPAVVGRLGTPDQFKIGVFGPTVNLAARLESLAKRLGVAIVIDESCAQYLNVEGTRLGARTRRLARVQPQGMSQQLQITELLTELVEAPSLGDTERASYETALTAVEAGRWAEARALLARLPADGPATFLSRHLDRYPGGPPPGWNGVIVLDSK